MKIIKSFIILINIGNLDLSIQSKNLPNLILEKSILIKGPKIEKSKKIWKASDPY
jgi:hypothetical protein